jgi:hypothetical protein
LLSLQRQHRVRCLEPSAHRKLTASGQAEILHFRKNNFFCCQCSRIRKARSQIVRSELRIGTQQSFEAFSNCHFFEQQVDGNASAFHAWMTHHRLCLRLDSAGKLHIWTLTILLCALRSSEAGADRERRLSDPNGSGRRPSCDPSWSWPAAYGARRIVDTGICACRERCAPAVAWWICSAGRSSSVLTVSYNSRAALAALF